MARRPERLVILTVALTTSARVYSAPCVFPEVAPGVAVPHYHITSAADVRRLLLGCPIDPPGYETHEMMIAINGHPVVRFVQAVAEQDSDVACEKVHAIATLGYFRDSLATESLIRIMKTSRDDRIRERASDALRPAPFASACRLARQLAQTEPNLYIAYSALLTITSCGEPADTMLIGEALKRLPQRFVFSVRYSMRRLTQTYDERHTWGAFGAPPTPDGRFIPNAQWIEELHKNAELTENVAVTASKCSVSARRRLHPYPRQW
jgi:hypothetical protein